MMYAEYATHLVVLGRRFCACMLNMRADSQENCRASTVPNWWHPEWPIHLETSLKPQGGTLHTTLQVGGETPAMEQNACEKSPQFRHSSAWQTLPRTHTDSPAPEKWIFVEPE